MNVYTSLDELPKIPLEPTATLGNLDGVHRGHQVMISRLQQQAERTGAPTMAVTFEPHTLKVIRPESDFRPLMTVFEKLRRLDDLGVDHVLVLPFDLSIAEMTPREFVEEILWEPLKVRSMFVGPDCAFGKGGEGDLRFLASEGRRLGFHVGVVEPLMHKGKRISSTWARETLSGGHLTTLNRILGRDHIISGAVVRGFRRGRELGYPTANINTLGTALPPFGVYAGWAYTPDGAKHGTMLNVGNRPTFDGRAVTVEAHIFNYSGDLYGKELRVALRQRLRDEVPFEGPDQLKAQLRRDAVEARKVLGIKRAKK